ncbi:MAG: efflux RND transporter periplasmic adaptor subunit [bacterium]|nr:efflux RND transporter periplasmic adaptor subunit [bacterium]
MHRTTKILILLVSLLIVAFLLFTYLPTSRSQNTAAVSKRKSGKPTPIYTTTVQRGTIQHTTFATGDILAAARIDVFSKVEGRLQTLLVEQGDTVQAGQIIAQITDTELKAGFERSTAELDALRAEWAQMQAGARPEEIAQAVDLEQQSGAEKTNAERLQKRTHALVQRGLRSTQDLEDANLRITRTQAAHSIAAKRLQLLRAGARIEDRQALQAHLRAAQAARRLAKAELQNAVITAPITGIVSHRHVDPGTYITDRTTLVTIVDMTTVKIKIPISERDLGHIQPGLSAQIRVDAYPQTVFKGIVRRISPTVDPRSRSGEVEIVSPNTDARLKPGMFAKVTLILEERHDVLLVPLQALSVQGKETAVFVVQDGKAHRRPVSTGLQNRLQVEIFDIPAGATIVLAGHQKLKDKASVKIVKPRPKEGS